MAEAIIKGLLDSKIIKAKDIYCTDPCEQRIKILKPLEISIVNSASDMGPAEILILAVKPDIVHDVIKTHGSTWNKKLIVSICAGTSLKSLEQTFPDQRFIRVMPNTPCMVNASASAYSKGRGLNVYVNQGTKANKEDCEAVETIFSAVGEIIKTDECKMDAVTGISGSGPAYVYMFIEALADAGVANGLTRQDSLKLAAQTVYGASKMVLSSDFHPAVLRNNVESPGGTTIAATCTLEKKGFRSAVIAAVEAAVEKSRSFEKK